MIMHYSRNSVYVKIGLILFMAGQTWFPESSFGRSLRWDSDVTDGDFHDEDNWIPGFLEPDGAPTASDFVRFNSSANVSFSGNAESSILDVLSGNVTFFLSGATYQSTSVNVAVPAFGIGSGGTATLSIEGGTLISADQFGGLITVGDRGGVGLINVNANATLQATSGTIIGFDQATGAIVVDDPTARFISGGATFVGGFGEGFLVAASGGQVELEDAFIGQLTGSTGELAVDNQNSAVDISSRIYVGNAGQGTLSITDGGLVKSRQAYVGRSTSGRGDVEITGSSQRMSIWTVEEGLFIGGREDTNRGFGKVVIQDAGMIIAASRKETENVSPKTTVKIWGASDDGSIPASELIVQRTNNFGNAFVIGREKAQSASTLGGSVIEVYGANGEFNAGVLDIQGGIVDAGNVRLFGNGQGAVESNATLRGHGYIKGDVINGALNNETNTTGGGFVELNGTYVPSIDSREGKAQLWIDGDFQQSGDGELHLTVVQENQVTESGVEHVPIRISGSALFDGTLKVMRPSEIDPSVGDRFRLIEYDHLGGRFRRFEGSVIDEDRFFGLDYTDGHLELMTLQTPRLSNGVKLGSDTATTDGVGLIVVTPGRPGFESSIFPMSDAIGSGQAGSWDVVTVDWHSVIPSDGSLDITGDFSAAQALRFEQSRITHDVGESLAFWLIESGLNYDRMHLVGVSGGAWHIDGLADRIKILAPQTHIHSTLLDGYIPPIVLPGETTSAVDEVGDTADWMDHYLDVRMRREGTYTFLSNAFNIDVSKIDPDFDLKTLAAVLGLDKKGHEYPWNWYLQTVSDPTNSMSNGWGFQRTFEYSGAIPSFDQYPKGSILILPDGVLFRRNPGLQLLFDDSDVIAGGDGTVTVLDPTTVIMETGSPVMMTVFVELSDITNFLEFEYLISMDNAGILSVYFDGEQVWGVSSEDLKTVYEGTEILPLSSGTIALGEDIIPGIYPLMFRLDQGADEITRATISNVVFGRDELFVIPEPSTSLLFAIVGYGIFCRGDRRFMNGRIECHV